MTAIDPARTEALTAILADLIAIPSPYPPGDSRAIAAYAAGRLGRAGYAVEVAARAPGVDNVVARMGAGRPRLAFNAHADTVGPGELGAWRTDPFKAVVEDGRLIGLGAANNKGTMAVQLWLADEVARRGGPARGEIVFSFVGDEERLGPDGTQFLRETGRLSPDALVLGAPTGNDLIIEERGVMWVRVTAEGRSAHAGEPEAGDNAILRMIRVLGAIERELLPRLASRRRGDKVSTLNVGQIRGGENTNVVPNRCVVEIDRRTLPGEAIDDALAEMRAVIAAAGEPAGSVAVEFVTGTNGFSAAPDGPCVAAFRAAVEARLKRPARFLEAVGASDGRYFAGDGIEIVVTGPGAAEQGHAANESIPLSEMADAAVIHLAAVERLLGLRR